MCFVIWLHCFGAEGGQKAVGMCWEKSCLQDHKSICNDCFNAFQPLMGQNDSSNRIYISGQWCSSTAKILNLFKLYALILLYKKAIDHWLQSCTGATN